MVTMTLYVRQQKRHRCKEQTFGLLIAKVRLKLKKVGKTTRPFRYDLNQIPYRESEKYIQHIRYERQSA